MISWSTGGTAPRHAKNPVKGLGARAHMGPVPTSMTAKTLEFTGGGIWRFVPSTVVKILPSTKLLAVPP